MSVLHTAHKAFVTDGLCVGLLYHAPSGSLIEDPKPPTECFFNVE